MFFNDSIHNKLHRKSGQSIILELPTISNCSIATAHNEVNAIFHADSAKCIWFVWNALECSSWCIQTQTHNVCNAHRVGHLWFTRNVCWLWRRNYWKVRCDCKAQHDQNEKRSLAEWKYRYHSHRLATTVYRHQWRISGSVVCVWA